ncbi:CSEP0094 putative effector protein [Blumeria hordei DH14]|uniref:CSEP0094 putative effector protein n=1 Tax=Blumeria graminis f. sp. hordei (strain DH14) TaxID=546991 RepID=N1JP39_BLUG1|nr:CSEP0094 putative effector protein [Blumeria hordei DH14]
MNLLHFTEIATILSLFASLSTADDLEDGYVMYNCFGKKFYSENVLNSVTEAIKHKRAPIRGYPQSFNADCYGGLPPYTIFPVPDIERFDIKTSGLYFFVVMDSRNAKVGMAYKTTHGHEPCKDILLQ